MLWHFEVLIFMDCFYGLNKCYDILKCKFFLTRNFLILKGEQKLRRFCIVVLDSVKSLTQSAKRSMNATRIWKSHTRISIQKRFQTPLAYKHTLSQKICLLAEFTKNTNLSRNFSYQMHLIFWFAEIYAVTISLEWTIFIITMVI